MRGERPNIRRRKSCQQIVSLKHTDEVHRVSNAGAICQILKTWNQPFIVRSDQRQHRCGMSLPDLRHRLNQNVQPLFLGNTAVVENERRSRPAEKTLAEDRRRRKVLECGKVDPVWYDDMRRANVEIRNKPLLVLAGEVERRRAIEHPTLPQGIEDPLLGAAATS